MYYILLMGSGVLVVLAIGQLCVPRRTETNIQLSLLLLVCFAWLAHGIGFRLGMLDVYPHLNKLHIPFLTLTGPLWYFYVRTLLTGDGWKREDRQHLLPAIFSVLLSLPFFMQSAEFKQEYVEIEVSDFVSLSIYLATRIADCTTVVYLVMAISQLQIDRARKSSTSQARGKSILFGLTIIAVAAALARLFGSVIGNHTVSVIVPIAIILPAFIGFYCLSHRHPWLMALGIRAPQVRRMSDEDADRLVLFRSRIREKRWHLNPDLKIQQLALRLGVSAHELSELINKESNSNFRRFINKLRIEHAKELLLDHAEMTLLDIAHESGFNSLSTFYLQFTRIESVPPAVYRSRSKSEH